MVSTTLMNFLRTSKLGLLGPACCGKGTLAQMLVQSFAIPHISTGEIFRKHLNDGTHFGEEIKQCMQKGELISDQLVTNLVLRTLQPMQSGFILDGFPRTLTQARELQKHYPELLVYHINVEDDTAIKRLSGRLTCGDCGSVFNILFYPPQEEGVCDQCRGPLIHRDDDQREIVIERLRLYHENTEPVIDFYRELGKLVTVDAEDLKPQELFNRVIEEMEESCSNHTENH